MNVTSLVFENNGMIPKRYTCEGSGINPPLYISDPPENCKSLTLFVHDPDAPESGFTHWVLWNIDPSIREIKEGTSPAGSCEGMNDSGSVGWVAPCPPSGMHHYEFHLCALDIALAIPDTSTKKSLLLEIEGHIMEETVLVGLYQKERVSE